MISIDELSKKDLYTNKRYQCMTNADIYEYDITAASLSIIKEYKLLDQELIDELSEIKFKTERNVRIGKLQKSIPRLSQQLKQGFRVARFVFMKSNKLKPADIIAIKKDAIFTLKRCYNRDFGEVHFVLKNRFNGYIANDGIEIYADDKGLTTKGLSRERKEQHKGNMFDFLKGIFKDLKHGVSSYLIRDMVFRKLVDFIDNYRKKRLQLGYYRELSKESQFMIKAGHGYNVASNYAESTQDLDLDTHYNLKSWILPFMNHCVIPSHS